MNVNKDLINTLIKERDKMFPLGLPTPPRGSCKTYLYLSLFLRYNAYNYYIQIYEKMTTKVTLEQAHKDIDIFVISQMPEPIW